MAADLERARALVEASKRIVVLTGAGISAESGVPTFRGTSGLWKSFRPEDLATPQAFARDPRLVWEWYAWRRALVGQCDPNPGHRALAGLAIDKVGVTLVTQNVDGLHHRAACDVAGDRDPAPAFPLEVHGALCRDRCSGCGLRSEGRTRIDTSSTATLPRCEVCGSLLRPDVVWFGEALDHETLTSAFGAAARADLCLIVGTSALVHPAASIPLETLGRGGTLVEVNLEPTPLSGVAAVSLFAPAGDVLPRLLGVCSGAH